MGGCEGPLSLTVQFDAASRTVHAREHLSFPRNSSVALSGDETWFTVLHAMMVRAPLTVSRHATTPSLQEERACHRYLYTAHSADAVYSASHAPCPFVGGLVGYLGYGTPLLSPFPSSPSSPSKRE